MFNFKPFLEGNWKCVHRQDLPWNQSQYPCTFQIYWNYHFCLCAHCQNSPKLHWTSEEHLWPYKYWNHANHFRFKLDILWNLISIYLVTSSALLLSWVTRKCTYQHFLSQTCETFVLSWLGFLKSSHNFSKTSECCRKCPKMFWQPQAPPKLLKGTVLVCFETVMTQSQYWVPFWNIFVEIVSIEFSLLIMYWRTITNSSGFVGQAWEIVLWWCVRVMS